MGYIYKLVDDIEIGFAQKGIVSLSHPIFEFKGSEGKFINFAKGIFKEYQKNGLNVKPSAKDLCEIEQWINVYKQTFGSGFQDIDIVSESMIIFCGIMQGFCGYYTTENLEYKEVLEEYLKKNKLKDKTAVIKIDESVFEKNHHWRTNSLNDPFEPFNGNPDDLLGYNGFTHPTTIVYNKNYNDYNELLKIYNGDQLRHSSNWFNNLSEEFAWQKERRLIFLLRSLEKNSSRIGCDCVYKFDQTITSFKEIVYCNIVDAIYYYSQGPRYLYLHIGDNSIKILNISDILNN